MEIWIALAALAAVLFLVGGIYFLKQPSRELPPPSSAREEVPAASPVEAPRVETPVEAPKVAKPAALSDKLAKTRGNLLSRLGKFVGLGAGVEIPTKEWEELEEALLEGDVGVATTSVLLERLKVRLPQSKDRALKDLIVEESEGLLSGLPHGLAPEGVWPKPYVISVVGVNGAGKTTTIGKLAHQLEARGKKVLLGACDTFRAAAISQLKVWADRANCQFVTGREGGDPGAVAFDSVTAGKARGMDVVLLDTAGRLHTKTNLMEELKKVHRVIKKVIPEAPHETWLVIDGTAGQNAIQQAREFQKALELSGVIVTKLDGTAKGGAILAIASELKLSIKFIGVGEGLDDLIPFEPKPFVQAILA